MVHSGYRRQGVGAELLAAAETTALSYGRWLLVLDTEEDSEAERFYLRRGYQRIGTIPHYAQSSRGGYAGTVVFYKQLPVHPSVLDAAP
jgi:ribosomal protein S18 acetylase RimI-like enzyme